jgi:hypothetical protein
MSYTYLTQFNSPNYTPASQTRGTWGVDRNIKHIDIHHWGDPATNPTIEGVIATFTNPNTGRSSNFIATGNGRRVACLVSPNDNSWATVQDNPYSISIECDPQWDDATYDVVGELIADIRSAYGAGLTLHPHSEFFNTACPGNVDLARLDAIAATKVSNAQWGQVTNANQPATSSDDQIKQAYRDILEREADQGGIDHYKSLGWTIDQIRSDLSASTEHAILVNNKAQSTAAALVTANPVPKQPQKVAPTNLYVRFDAPMDLMANKPTTNVYDISKATQSELDASVVKRLAQNDPFIAVGKYTHPLGAVYFMTGYSFGSADVSGTPDHSYGVNTVDLSPAVTVPTAVLPLPSVPPAPEPTPVDGAFTVPVTVIPVDPNKKWQDTFTRANNGEYNAIQSVVVKDLTGLNKDLQLLRGQSVNVAGQFIKDGVGYYRTQHSVNTNTWYGIPINSNGYGTLSENDDGLFGLYLADEIIHDGNAIKDTAIKTVASIDGILRNVFHNKKK